MKNIIKKLSQINDNENVSLSREEIKELPINLQYELYKLRLDYFTRDFLNLFLYKHQRKWIEHITKNRLSLLLAPRDHGKSETVGKALVTHQICFNMNIRILFISETIDSVALRSLNQVRYELEYNQDLLNFFRDYYNDKNFTFRVRGQDWTQDNFTINRNANLKEPTVKAAGARSAITGQHYDLIICDDIISDKSVRVERQREITREWFTKTLLSLLSDNEISKMVVIGTPKHYDDIYKTLEEGKVFAVRRDRAIIEGDLSDTSQFDYIIDEKSNTVHVVFSKREYRDNFKLLWEYNERTGHGKKIEDLLLKKYNMDSIDPGQFTKEIQCEIQDGDLSLFSYSLLEQSKDIHVSYIDSIEDVHKEFSNKSIKHIIQSWDLSIVSDKEKANKYDRDYTVGVTLGIDDKFNKYLLNIYRERGLTTYEIKSKIFELYNKFKSDAVIIERNSAQDYLVQELSAETMIPLYPHSTNRLNKTDSMRGVIQLWHANLFNKKIKFPYNSIQDKRKTDIIFNELHRYGAEKHDDTVMAIWFTLYFISNSELLKKYRESHRFERPKLKNRPQIRG